MTPTATLQRFRRRRLTWLSVAVVAGVVWWFLSGPTREELESQVAQAVAKQDWNRAELALTQLHRRTPRNAEILDLLAQVALRQGRRGDCLRWREKSAEASPQPFERLLGVAGQAVEFGRPIDAERLFRKANGLSPERLESYAGLARLYLGWRRSDALRSVIAEAEARGLSLSDDPTLLWLWVVGDRVTWEDDEAESWLELVRREQPDDVYAPSALVEQFVRHGRVAEAKSLLQTSDAFHRKPAERLRSAVMIDLAAGRFQAARDALNEIPGDAARSAEEWLLRGEVEQGLGNREAAAQAYSHAVQIDPWLVDAAYRYGRVLRQLERHEESEKVLERAARTDDVVRRCLQLLQAPSTAETGDFQTVAELAFDLGQSRWAQLVAELAARQSGGSQPSSERLGLLRDRKLAPLAIAEPPSPPPSPSRDRKVAPRPLLVDTPTLPDRTVAWTDATNELGVNFTYEFGRTRERWLMETLGGGVATLDYDGDGWTDLFFAQGGDPATSGEVRGTSGRLWRNRDENGFGDQTENATLISPGYAHGCAVGDFNQDGFPDLLVCRYGGLTWLVNRGDGTWQDETLLAGLENSRWNTSAAFADLDGDGDLDIYVAGYCHAPFSRELRTCQDSGQPSPCRPNAYPAEPDALYENLGDGRFADRSRESLQSATAAYGLGVAAADFDGDGHADVFVGNDTMVNSLWTRPSAAAGPLMREDRGLISGVGVDGTGRAEACMGIACGDYDGDQQLDLFVTNFHDETCTLYRNLGSLQFEDETERAGLSNAGRRLMGWGCQFVDSDNDGWLDLMLVNGYLHDVPQKPQFYRNAEGRFVEWSDRAGASFQRPVIGRSLATWDFNRDGRSDVVITHQVEPAVVLQNISQSDHSVTLKLSGRDGPRDATGAVVRARVGTRTLMRLVSAQGGYLSACSPEVLIGLGASDGIDELVVEWPVGAAESFGAIPASSRQLILEGAGVPVSLGSQDAGK